MAIIWNVQPTSSIPLDEEETEDRAKQAVDEAMVSLSATVSGYQEANVL